MEWFFESAANAENVKYYECGADSLRHGMVSYTAGIAFIVYGSVVEIMYAIVIMVMMKREYRVLSCYKIMMVLGIYDMASIGVDALLSGYFMLVGASYCTYPSLIYVTGALALGLWCGSCMTCLILVVNRLLDVCNQRLMEMLFGNNRTYAVLMIPHLYSLYICFFTPPVLFNSEYFTWLFDPLTKLHPTAVFFIQCSSICAANLTAALPYVYMQFFPAPPHSPLISHIFWLLYHVYAPTDNADDDVENDFYGRLQDTIHEVPRRDLKIVLGDFNAQLGGDRHGIERTFGPSASSGHISDNGNTYFQHRRIHKKTWNSPDGVASNEIDHIRISRNHDARAYRGADVGSDHYLVRATLKLKLKHLRSSSIVRPFTVEKLMDPIVSSRFTLELRSRFEVFGNTSDIEKDWVGVKTTVRDCAD
ncbi:hypothetical protein Y032_0097g3001 [Ancylostoma ceylanicum]|uniref:Endonuclease/exonuclease/phosphatase domain-containing protein n=1 Tax=Ancylostoma ceylanicum TaxID=53326 RepID=A0A016TJX8_9BILA|nr:hypothetical protein Y032_0097g3001 [Ancylostoma ceylanicum]